MTSSTPLDSMPWTPGAPLPLYADRATLSRIISHLYFPVAPRTLREWPLEAMTPNKRVVYNVSDALAYAQARLSTSPRYRQGGN